MRCVVRLIILTCAAFVLLIYCAVSHANSKIVVAFDANDEEARRILENAIPSPTASNSNPNSPSNSSNRPQSMSVSVALVLIVSLVSVALLITGIIIIAVTLDPSSNTEEDDESDLEPDDSPSNDPSKSPCSSRFDYSLLTEL